MHILAADIGGTNSRFALFSARPFALLDHASLPSAAPDFDAVLDSLASLRPHMAPHLSALFALAVAGPLRGAEHATLSNLPYAIDAKALRESRGVAATLLINDFSAQAWACLTPALTEALPLAPWTRDITPNFAFPSSDPGRARAPCALVGAGTGLGMALLTPAAPAAHDAHDAHDAPLDHDPGEARGVPEAADGGHASRPWRGVRIMPSEGGHTVFPFVGKEENAFALYAASRKHSPYLRPDDIVSGSGLALLHAFLTGDDLTPERVTALPDFASSRSCEWFARFYGRVCRNLALTCLPLAGLLVTGGLAARCPHLVRHEAFRAELDDAPGAHRRLLQDIPFWHNLNQFSGLWGAAMAGLASLTTR